MRIVGPLDRLPGGLLLLLGCLMLYLPGLGAMDLWPSHEARAAQNAQSILDSGDWLLPHLFNGTPELQKPPGHYWLVASLGWLNGGQIDAWCVRLPSVLAATATVLVLYAFCLPKLGGAWSLAAGFLLMSSVHWFALARTGRIDMPLTLIVTATLSLSTCIPVSRTRKNLLRIALILGLASALYLKGLIGWMMIQGTWLVMNLLLRRANDIPRPVLLHQILLGIGSFALFLPWFLTVNASTDGELFRTLVVYHHFNRAFGGAEALAGHPVWFYAVRIAVDLLPWAPLFAASLWLNRKRLPLLFQEPLARFAAISFLVIVLGLSASRFKRADYLLPAYPWFTLLLVLMLRFQGASIPRSVVRIGIALYFTAAMAYVFAWQPRLEAPYRVDEFGTAIRRETHGQIVFFRVEAHLLAWHLKPPIRTMVEWNDLRDASPCFAVVPENLLDESREELGPGSIHVLLNQRDYSAAAPHRPYLFIRIDRIKASR